MQKLLTQSFTSMEYAAEERVIRGIKPSNIENIVDLSFDLDFNMYV